MVVERRHPMSLLGQIVRGDVKDQSVSEAGSGDYGDFLFHGLEGALAFEFRRFAGAFWPILDLNLKHLKYGWRLSLMQGSLIILRLEIERPARKRREGEGK